MAYNLDGEIRDGLREVVCILEVRLSLLIMRIRDRWVDLREEWRGSDGPWSAPDEVKIVANSKAQLRQPRAFVKAVVDGITDAAVCA